MKKLNLSPGILHMYFAVLARSPASDALMCNHCYTTYYKVIRI